MPRGKRQISSTNIYHVICRGNNKNDVFLDNQDYVAYINILKKIKKEHKFKIYAYCLMKNHIHLLLNMQKQSISYVMMKINLRYAYYLKYKYLMTGHVFQGRFKSECVEDDEYFMTVFDYIHNNPVKAEIVKSPELYKWSSAYK